MEFLRLGNKQKEINEKQLMLEILIENRAKAEKERNFREKEKREAEKRVVL